MFPTTTPGTICLSDLKYVLSNGTNFSGTPPRSPARSMTSTSSSSSSLSSGPTSGTGSRLNPSIARVLFDSFLPRSPSGPGSVDREGANGCERSSSQTGRLGTRSSPSTLAESLQLGPQRPHQTNTPATSPILSTSTPSSPTPSSTDLSTRAAKSIIKRDNDAMWGLIVGPLGEAAVPSVWSSTNQFGIGSVGMAREAGTGVIQQEENLVESWLAEQRGTEPWVQEEAYSRWSSSSAPSSIHHSPSTTLVGSTFPASSPDQDHLRPSSAYPDNSPRTPNTSATRFSGASTSSPFSCSRSSSASATMSKEIVMERESTRRLKLWDEAEIIICHGDIVVGEAKRSKRLGKPGGRGAVRVKPEGNWI